MDKIYRSVQICTFFGVGCFLLSCITFESAAQGASSIQINNSAQVFRLKAHTLMDKNYWKHLIYRFPEFQEATIVMRESSLPDKKVLLNFNIHQKKIEIIIAKGDTIDMPNAIEISSINAGGHEFYNDQQKGYVEKLNQTPIYLGVKHSLDMVIESPSGSIDSRISDWNVPSHQYDRLYLRKESYFFADRNNHLRKATWPSIMKLFPDLREEIKGFILENEIDFKVKEDLILLLDFCYQVKHQHLFDSLTAKGKHSDVHTEYLPPSGEMIFALKANKVLSRNERSVIFYRFPKFQKASIEFQEGFKPSNELLLNLNIYLERIEIIDQKGDTTSLPYMHEIRSIKIGDHLFLYDNRYTKGYVEKLGQSFISLGTKYNFSLSGGGRIFTKYIDWRSPAWLQDRYYTRWETYFFVDMNNQLHQATPQAIFNLLPNSKYKIKWFIRKNKISFKVKDDLFKLLDFCNQLEKTEQAAR